MRKSKKFLDGTFGHFQFFYFVILTVKAHGEAYSLVGPETEDDLDPEKPLCGPNVWPSAGNLAYSFILLHPLLLIFLFHFRKNSIIEKKMYIESYPQKTATAPLK